MSAIKAVLRNEQRFYFAYGKKFLYFNDFNPENDDDMSINSVCVQDLDKDGISEILLEVSPSGDILILRYESDTVYGFVFRYRALIHLKKDGTYVFSNGAYSNYIYRLKFSKNTYTKTEMLCEDTDEPEGMWYRINGKNVTSADIDAYWEAFHKKEDATWTDWEVWKKKWLQ